MADETFDLTILGGGPAGYLAAERAGARGKRVLLVEKEHLGGVCLNSGCIPTKTLLHSAKLFHGALHSEQFGVMMDKPRYDLGKAMAWKRKVIETLRRGIDYQMKRHKVTVLQGSGSIKDRNTLEVEGKRYRGSELFIATGSSPMRLPIPGGELSHVLTSKEILDISELPGSLVVIGGGIIGLEFASYFRLLGVPVTVIELLPEIVAVLDPDIGALLRKSMPDVTFHLNSRVESIGEDSVTFLKAGKRESIKADMVLLSVGRKPNTEGLGLEEAGVAYDRTGVRVNERMQTNVPGVYAVGDVNGKSLLAHSAYRMAEVAVRTSAGEADRMRYNAVPWVVYSYPEAAGVGLSESGAREQGREIGVATLPLRVNGRFVAEHGNEPGFCKVIVDSGTRVLLGVQMVGASSSEIIYGAAAMIEAELRVQDIREIIFPHPTVSEVIRDTLWEMR